MYRLAGHLKMTVGQLGRECDSAELVHWMAMAQIEPFGGPTDDLRAVMGPTAIINNLRQMFGGAGSAMLDPRNVIPWGEKPEEVVEHDPRASDYDPEAHAAAIKALLISKANT